MHGATVPDGRSVDVQVHYDFDGEAEMKTLQEVHDMLVQTGYIAEAIAVAEAIKQLEQQCTPFK